MTVYARHIFYDLMDNLIKKYEPEKNTQGAAVLAKLSESCLSEHSFTFYSDIDTTAEEVLFEHVNPVDALLDSDGFVDKYKAELARDWWDVFLVKRVGRDTDVQIREGKNLLGVSYDVDETSVVTRIMPTGQDKDGETIYLPELYIDSPNIDKYIHPKWIHLDVSEAKESDDKDDKKNYTKYARDLDAIPGFYNGHKQGYAWCDVFVDWCFVTAYGKDAALKLLCQPMKSAGAGCRYSRGYYKAKGRLFNTPQPGDQIFLCAEGWRHVHGGHQHRQLVLQRAAKSADWRLSGRRRDARALLGRDAA